MGRIEFRIKEINHYVLCAVTKEHLEIQQAIEKDYIEVDHRSPRGDAFDETRTYGLITIKRLLKPHPYIIHSVTNTNTGKMLSSVQAFNSGLLQVRFSIL